MGRRVLVRWARDTSGTGRLGRGRVAGHYRPCTPPAPTSPACRAVRASGAATPPGARRWAQSKSRRGPSGAGLRHGGRERVMRVGASTPSPRQQERPTSRGQQYVVTVAVMAGTFLAVMDISVVNVSLPHMMGNFGQTLSAITWVATTNPATTSLPPVGT